MIEVRSDPVRRLAALSFLLLVATLPWTIAAMSVALGLCGALTVWGWVRSRQLPPMPRPLIGPALAWLAALVIAAWFAEDRGASLARLGKGLLPLGVMLAAWHARDPRLGRRALAVLLISATTVAVLGLALWVAHGAAFPERARGAVGHYMTFAGQLLLWLPLAVAITLEGRVRNWRIGSALAAGVGALALAATFTRSAWIGLFVALAVMIGLTRPRRLLALAAGTALLIAIAPAPYRARLASAFDPSHAANLERRHMWEAGVRMYLDHPLTGVGLQDLHPVYERYRSPEAREPAGHLHNVFIQIAATMGTFGLLAFLWLYATLFRISALGLRRRLARGGIGPALQLGVTAALAGFLVAGAFEWNFGDEELLDLLYVLVGMAVAAAGWASDAAAPRQEAAGP